MEEVKIENIPAFQRKRAISAKARKLEKNQYKLPTTNLKPTKTRKRPSQKDEYSTDIPIHDEFPNPENLETLRTPSRRSAGIKEMKICGNCDAYFESINVAVIKLTSPLREGDEILIEKNDGLFQQIVTSMQIDRKAVSLARSGSDIGLKVLLPPKVGGTVYKII